MADGNSSFEWKYLWEQFLDKNRRIEKHHIDEMLLRLREGIVNSPKEGEGPLRKSSERCLSDIRPLQSKLRELIASASILVDTYNSSSQPGMCEDTQLQIVEKKVLQLSHITLKIDTLETLSPVFNFVESHSNVDTSNLASAWNDCGEMKRLAHHAAGSPSMTSDEQNCIRSLEKQISMAPTKVINFVHQSLDLLCPLEEAFKLTILKKLGEEDGLLRIVSSLKEFPFESDILPVIGDKIVSLWNGIFQDGVQKYLVIEDTEKTITIKVGEEPINQPDSSPLASNLKTFFTFIELLTTIDGLQKFRTFLGSYFYRNVVRKLLETVGSQRQLAQQMHSVEKFSYQQGLMDFKDFRFINESLLCEGEEGSVLCEGEEETVENGRFLSSIQGIFRDNYFDFKNTVNVNKETLQFGVKQSLPNLDNSDESFSEVGDLLHAPVALADFDGQFKVHKWVVEFINVLNECLVSHGHKILIAGKCSQKTYHHVRELYELFGVLLHFALDRVYFNPARTAKEAPSGFGIFYNDLQTLNYIGLVMNLFVNRNSSETSNLVDVMRLTNDALLRVVHHKLAIYRDELLFIGSKVDLFNRTNDSSYHTQHAISHMRRVFDRFTLHHRSVLPLSAFFVFICQLVECVAKVLISRLTSLVVIAESDIQIVSNSLKEIVCFFPKESDSLPEVVALKFIGDILDSSLHQIDQMWGDDGDDSSLRNYLSGNQVVSIIKAVFEDSSFRSKVISRIIQHPPTSNSL